MRMMDKNAEQQFVEPPYSNVMEQLLELIREYMAPDEIDLVVKAYQLALESSGDIIGTSLCPVPPLDYALAVTTILAQMMHVDAIGISAGLVFESVDAETLAP